MDSPISSNCAILTHTKFFHKLQICRVRVCVRVRVKIAVWIMSSAIVLFDILTLHIRSYREILRWLVVQSRL